VPKSKKTNKTGEENRTAWRTPVKLPTSAAVAPMKSLYAPENLLGEINAQTLNAADAAPSVSVRANDKSSVQQSESANLLPEIPVNEQDTKSSNVGGFQNANISSTSAADQSETENTATRMSAAEFLKLLRTDKMDFYSLAEILRGSSMALYCVLYAESLAKGESRCQIRQSELMMRAGINNPATLYKQERWLTVLGLISKSVRLGNHNGASYEVRPLQILPVPDFIIEQFDGYLSELVR
jgi:hypothetical protein